MPVSRRRDAGERAKARRRQRLLDGDGFGEVARLIDVVSEHVGDVISEQLEGQDAQEGLDDFVAGRYGEGVFGDACDGVVAFGNDAEDASAASFDFL